MSTSEIGKPPSLPYGTQGTADEGTENSEATSAESESGSPVSTADERAAALDAQGLGGTDHVGDSDLGSSFDVSSAQDTMAASVGDEEADPSVEPANKDHVWFENPKHREPRTS